MIVNIFGLSGVGKTTLMKSLCRTGQYTMPAFTVTREPRPDDEKSQFEYVTVDEYINIRSAGGLLLDMDDGHRYYGYRSTLVTNELNYLLYGSPLHLNAICELGGIRVLIIGDADYGMKIRGGDDETRIQERKVINRFLNLEYYSDRTFQKQMSIIFENDFSDPELLAKNLHDKISDLL